MNREFWKATGIRALRTFLQVIAGAWTAGKLITELDWKTILTAALSAAVFSVITSVATGLPEVDTSVDLEEFVMDDTDEYEEGDEDE